MPHFKLFSSCVCSPFRKWGASRAGEDCTLRTTQSVVKKFKFFVRCAAFRLRGQKALEALVQDTLLNIDRQFEMTFSRPEDLDWLENDLRENGHRWKRRHQVMTADYLKAH